VRFRDCADDRQAEACRRIRSGVFLDEWLERTIEEVGAETGPGGVRRR